MNTTVASRDTVAAHKVRRLVSDLLERKLISNKTVTELTVTAVPGDGLIWHADQRCTTGVPVVCTTRVPLAQFPTALGDLFETLCDCVADSEHLARLGGWNDVETAAVVAWMHSEPAQHRDVSPTQRRDALCEFQALVPSRDDLKTLSGRRGQRIRKMIADRAAELEAAAAAEAAAEAKREAARQARREAQQARKAAAAAMPWDALTQVFAAQVDAGIPPHVAATGLAESAYSFTMLENGIEFPGLRIDFECGDDRNDGPPSLLRSDGAEKFRQAVDAAIDAYETAEPELAQMMSRRMHMGHPLDHPWF